MLTVTQSHVASEGCLCLIFTASVPLGRFYTFLSSHLSGFVFLSAFSCSFGRRRGRAVSLSDKSLYQAEMKNVFLTFSELLCNNKAIFFLPVKQKLRIYYISK